jgi:hypothetical protein
VPALHAHLAPHGQKLRLPDLTTGAPAAAATKKKKEAAVAVCTRSKNGFTDPNIKQTNASPKRSYCEEVFFKREPFRFERRREVPEAQSSQHRRHGLRPSDAAAAKAAEAAPETVAAASGLA